MKSILFVRRQHTYLPEIAAYIRFLDNNCFGVKAYDSFEIQDCNPMDFDVVWKFLGTDIASKGRYMVHEYNSLSAGIFPHFKNRIKAKVNRRPNRRVFLNNMVRKDFPFQDNVPYGLRDMGIAASFFSVNPDPEYDFVYAGSIHRGDEVTRMLEHFAGPMRGSTLLLVGSVNSDVLAHYRHYDNIIFEGRVSYTDVPALMAKGRYGLNLIPDHYPFNVQTATKVLEYCAVGLPVVSLRYQWSEKFMAQAGGKCFWLDPDFGNLTLENVENFDFKIPCVENWRWKKVIADSGIFDFLETEI